MSDNRKWNVQHVVVPTPGARPYVQNIVYEEETVVVDSKGRPVNKPQVAPVPARSVPAPAPPASRSTLAPAPAPQPSQAAKRAPAPTVSSQRGTTNPSPPPTIPRAPGSSMANGGNTPDSMAVNSSAAPNPGIIAGIVIPILLVAILFFVYRHRKMKKKKDDENSDIFRSYVSDLSEKPLPGVQGIRYSLTDPRFSVGDYLTSDRDGDMRYSIADDPANYPNTYRAPPTKTKSFKSARFSKVNQVLNRQSMAAYSVDEFGEDEVIEPIDGTKPSRNNDSPYSNVEMPKAPPKSVLKKEHTKINIRKSQVSQLEFEHAEHPPEIPKSPVSPSGSKKSVWFSQAPPISNTKSFVSEDSINEALKKVPNELSALTAHEKHSNKQRGENKRRNHSNDSDSDDDIGTLDNKKLKEDELYKSANSIQGKNSQAHPHLSTRLSLDNSGSGYWGTFDFQ